MKIPVLKLRDVLLTSIQEEIDDDDALLFQEDVLREASESQAAGIVIDISALDVVDSFMARVLNDTAEAVRLLGLEVVICGMQPMVAISLTEMGRRLIGVETSLDLDHAMEKLELARQASNGGGHG
jgi:rsbT antagonist protein RsbS